VIEMTRFIILLLLLLFSQFSVAGPGKPHKEECYDYHDYVSSGIQAKAFSAYDGETIYAQLWTFERPNPGTVIRTEVTSTGGVDTNYVVNEFRATTSAFNWVSNDRYDVAYPPPNQPTRTRVFEPPVPVLTDSMCLGYAWGSAADLNSAPPDPSGYVEKDELLAIESIQVPAGTYQNCLKIHRSRFGRDRMDWICPEMGLVKRVMDSGWIMQLESVTTE
jgi:hypothetical protein